MRSAFLSLVVLGGSVSVLFSVAGCDNRNPSMSDGGGVRTCFDDRDCDDGFDCTIESCGVGAICQYTALDARCDMGQTCDERRGCVSGTSCTSNADCDDSVACTVDTCGVGGLCRHMALDELCTDPGMPECDVTMGCVRGTGCASAADCNDSVACTIDSCGADRMCRHTGMDGLCMAGEVCRSTGCFMPMDCTTPADCDDGEFCNGTETCDTKFGCMPGAPPVCNDSEMCTVDTCDSTLDRCVFTCDRTMAACASFPGCEAPPVSCIGTFNGTPTRGDGCFPALTGATRAPNFGTLTFAYDGVVLTVTDAEARFPDLSDVTEPACPSFVATATVDGGCRETYTLRGTFSDDDTFAGEFVAEYEETDGFSCSFVGCGSSYTTAVTATRR
jgi:hypothetical protein